MNDLINAIKAGAKLVDVRTPVEFQSGHAAGTVNMPLQQFEQEGKSLLNFEGPVVLCCQSGMRSHQATSYLHHLGKTDAYNAGGWMELQRILDQIG